MDHEALRVLFGFGVWVLQLISGQDQDDNAWCADLVELHLPDIEDNAWCADLLGLHLPDIEDNAWCADQDWENYDKVHSMLIIVG